MLKRMNQLLMKCMIPQTEQETYETIGKEIKKFVRAKYVSIFLYKNGLLQRVWASSPILYYVVPRKNGILNTSVKSKKSFITTYNTLEKIHPQFRLLRIKSSMGIPLVYGNDIIGFLSLLSPISSKFTKQDLKMVKLFAPIAALTLKKASLHDNLQKAVKTRDMFISTAAHEIKNPLTTIYLYSQHLKQLVDQNRLPELKEINLLLTTEKRIVYLIDELLEISRANQGNLIFRKEQTNIEEIINNSILTFKHIHPYHKLKVQNKIKAPLYVWGDQNKLIQVFDNVLTNACKYSARGSTVFFSIDNLKHSIKIEIKDQGIGVPAQHIQDIFKPFFQFDKNTNGLGLGLYLAKTILDKHEGKIEFFSKYKQGSTVVIYLPIYQLNDRNSIKPINKRIQQPFASQTI